MSGQIQVANQPLDIQGLSLEEAVQLLRKPEFATLAGVPEGTPPHEILAFVSVAQALGRNPFRREVYLVKRWDSDKRREVYTLQMGIDGWRSTAHETGMCDGISEAEYEYDEDGNLKYAVVSVWRKGCAHPFRHRVAYSEYVQKKKDGSPNRFWALMPHVMLGKCAETGALRKAFPNRFAGVYAPEEMQSMDEYQVSIHPKAQDPKPAQIEDHGSKDALQRFIEACLKEYDYAFSRAPDSGMTAILNAMENADIGPVDLPKDAGPMACIHAAGEKLDRAGRVVFYQHLRRSCSDYKAQDQYVAPDGEV